VLFPDRACDFDQRGVGVVELQRVLDPLPKRYRRELRALQGVRGGLAQRLDLLDRGGVRILEPAGGPRLLERSQRRLQLLRGIEPAQNLELLEVDPERARVVVRAAGV